MTGWELLQRLRQQRHRAHLPVIVGSAVASFQATNSRAASEPVDTLPGARTIWGHLSVDQGCGVPVQGLTDEWGQGASIDRLELRAGIHRMTSLVHHRAYRAAGLREPLRRAPP